MTEPAFRFPYLREGTVSALVGTSLLGAASAAPFAVAVLHREAIAIDLELDAGTINRWVGAGVAVFVLGAIAAAAIGPIGARLRVMGVAALLPATLAVVSAGVRDAFALRCLLAAMALTWAPTLVMARSVSLEVCGARSGWRAIAVGWAGVGAGVASIGLWEMVADVANWGYQLAAAGIVAGLGAVLLAGSTPVGTDPDGVRSGDPSTVAAREPLVLLALVTGAATLGTSTLVLDHLAVRWGRDLGGQGGLFALGGLATAFWLAFGHWFNGIARRSARGLTGLAGAAVAVGASLMMIAAGSVTYIGALVCFAGAALAFALAACAIESALSAGRAASDRHGSVSLAAAAAGIGGLALLAGPTLMDQIARGWVIVVFASPALLIGLIVAYAERAAAPAGQHAATPDQVAPVQVMGAAPGAPLLECRNLEVGYGNVQVLFDVSLTVDDARIIALMGTNGAGKTTLLRTISGLLTPTSGTIRFGGVDITSFDPTWRVQLGVTQIAGGQALAEDLTVGENLRVFGHSLGRDRRRLNDNIDAALEVFPRLAERRDQLASTLSGGEKQMLALSKALICSPRLLIIDEFSLGLAPRIVGELLPVVERINANGTAILMVEQSVNIALSIADHAYCMEKGEIVFDGSAAALREDPSALRSVYLEGVSAVVAS